MNWDRPMLIYIIEMAKYKYKERFLQAAREKALYPRESPWGYQLTFPQKIWRLEVSGIIYLKCQKGKIYNLEYSTVSPWTVAYKAPPSMGFPRQEYWRGLPFLSPEDLPNPGIKPRSLCLVRRLFTIWATREDSYNWRREKQLIKQGKTKSS